MAITPADATRIATRHLRAAGFGGDINVRSRWTVSNTPRLSGTVCTEVTSAGTPWTRHVAAWIIARLRELPGFVVDASTVTTGRVYWRGEN